MTNMKHSVPTAFNFSDIDRLFLGFNDMLRDLDSVATAKGTFPPYDIIQTPDGYTVTLAVAGFTDKDIAVEIDKHNVLTVRGAVEQSLPENHTAIVKMIAGRKFTRSWRLAEGLEVSGVDLSHGLLTVTVTKTAPVAPAVTRLAINTK